MDVVEAHGLMCGAYQQRRCLRAVRCCAAALQGKCAVSVSPGAHGRRVCVTVPTNLQTFAQRQAAWQISWGSVMAILCIHFLPHTP